MTRTLFVALALCLPSWCFSQSADEVAAIRAEVREAKASLLNAGAGAFRNEIQSCYSLAREQTNYRERFRRTQLCLVKDYVGLIAYMGMKRALGPQFSDEFYEPKTQEERIKLFLKESLGASEQSQKRFTDPIFSITLDEFGKDPKQ